MLVTLRLVQRRALVVLFTCLATALAAVSAYALAGGGGSAGRLVVGLAAAAVAAWFVTLAAGAVRHRR